MMQSQLVDKSYFKCPETLPLEPFKALEKHQVLKISAVALACIAFFAFQGGCSWPFVAGVTFLCTTMTLLSETFIRTDSQKNIRWTNTDVNKPFLIAMLALRLLVMPVVICLMTSAGVVPMQAAALQIMAGNLRIIFLATVVAPVAEEILFRGFIQERFEDLAMLVDHHIYPLSERVKQGFSVGLQSLFFGAIHIMGNQVATFSSKIFVLCGTSLVGFWLTLVKNEDRSLLSPIAIHSAQNTGMTLGLLASRCLS
jgi:membrane protease YdiL (CAAX protease family)